MGDADVIQESQQEVVWENERHALGWGPGSLIPGKDPKRFVRDESGAASLRRARHGGPKMQSSKMVAVLPVLPEGWAWLDEWHIDTSRAPVDEQGWSFATDFGFFALRVRADVKVEAWSDAGEGYGPPPAPHRVARGRGRAAASARPRVHDKPHTEIMVSLSEQRNGRMPVEFRLSLPVADVLFDLGVVEDPAL